MRLETLIKEVRERLISVPGVFGKGCPQKTWYQCTDQDLEEYGLKNSDALDEDIWTECLGNRQLALAPSAGSTPKAHEIKSKVVGSSTKKKPNRIDCVG